MKKFLFIILITSSFSLNSFSQIVWAPQSAKWIYNGQGQITSYIEIEYVKDTIVLEKQSKVLRKTQFTYRSQTNDVITSSLGNEITYQADSVIYLYGSGVFDTLFSFSSNIGDTWQLNCCQGDNNCFATVMDTGSILINSQNLRYLALEYDFGDLYPIKVNDTIIERIGTTTMYILPCDIIAGLLDGNEGSKLRCYSDNEFGSYSNNFNKPCDYLTSIDNQSKTDILQSFPNPCSEELNITFQNYKYKHIEIRDLSGKVWFSKDTNDLKYIVNLSMMPDGILILSIVSSNSTDYKKIIKTSTL